MQKNFIENANSITSRDMYIVGFFPFSSSYTMIVDLYEM